MTQARNFYDVPLDLESNNSNSVIIGRIKPGSRVLEFGPSYGRMTRHLHQQMACEVTIVELDEAAGKQAATFAKRAYIGPTDGHIEGYTWLQREDLTQYDYFIFADVLEHLIYPWQVLKQIQARMRPTARVIVSVPNLGYHGLLFDLVQQKFDYRATGLLDHTHLRFFTHQNLGRMVDQIGLKIVDAEHICVPLESSEFKDAGQTLPPAVRDYIKAQLGADIYQFVVVLAKPQ
jgi:O-antigen biosynthesis protein